MTTMNQAWRDHLHHVFLHGELVSPRGEPVYELQGQTIKVDMLNPVLTLAARNANRRFMVAEARWILSGSDLVADLPEMPKMMRACSDDGIRMAGAYGPRYVAQRAYVVRKLLEDPATRQATMTIWERDPAPSRDIPCTVAITFLLRGGRLNTHVFMRSSDVWLGLPYDVFAFSMMTCDVLGYLNGHGNTEYRPGTLYLTAASSHLYARDRADADRCLFSHDGSEINDTIIARDELWTAPGATLEWLTSGGRL